MKGHPHALSQGIRRRWDGLMAPTPMDPATGNGLQTLLDGTLDLSSSQGRGIRKLGLTALARILAAVASLNLSADTALQYLRNGVSPRSCGTRTDDVDVGVGTATDRCDPVVFSSAPAGVICTGAQAVLNGTDIRRRGRRRTRGPYAGAPSHVRAEARAPFTAEPAVPAVAGLDDISPSLNDEAGFSPGDDGIAVVERSVEDRRVPEVGPGRDASGTCRDRVVRPSSACSPGLAPAPRGTGGSAGGRPEPAGLDAPLEPTSPGELAVRQSPGRRSPTKLDSGAAIPATGPWASSSSSAAVGSSADQTERSEPSAAAPTLLAAGNQRPASGDLTDKHGKQHPWPRAGLHSTASCSRRCGRSFPHRGGSVSPYPYADLWTFAREGEHNVCNIFLFAGRCHRGQGCHPQHWTTPGSADAGGTEIRVFMRDGLPTPVGEPGPHGRPPPGVGIPVAAVASRSRSSSRSWLASSPGRLRGAGPTSPVGPIRTRGGGWTPRLAPGGDHRQKKMPLARYHLGQFGRRPLPQDRPAVSRGLDALVRETRPLPSTKFARGPGGAKQSLGTRNGWGLCPGPRRLSWPRGRAGRRTVAGPRRLAARGRIRPSSAAAAGYGRRSRGVTDYGGPPTVGDEGTNGGRGTGSRRPRARTITTLLIGGMPPPRPSPPFLSACATKGNRTCPAYYRTRALEPCCERIRTRVTSYISKPWTLEFCRYVDGNARGPRRR